MSNKARGADAKMYPAIEAWCAKYQKAIIGCIMAAFALMSLLLFNIRVSEGGDDSTYIIRAFNFIKDGSYPSFQGPIYPMFLSIFVGIFGIKLGLLKMTSLVLMLISIWLFYRIFRNRIQLVLLFSTLLISGLSSFYIYFSSQTYSEALFILLQLPAFALVFWLSDYNEKKIPYKKLLLLSLSIVLLCLTRTVGIGALIATLLFFVLEKRYKEAGIITGGFIVIMLLFLGLKSVVWEKDLFDGSQANTLMYKHPYQLDKGKETFTGFMTRFVDNSNLYLSKHLMHMVGLKAERIKSINGFVTILLYLIFLYGAYGAFRKNKYLFFMALYIAVMLGITFIVLQKLWDQYRLIVPFFSGMVMVLLYGVFTLAQKSKGKWLPQLAILLVFFCSGSVLINSFAKIDLLTLRKNLKGDIYEGYTNDWQHYLSMAEYAGEHLANETYVAVRKPNMAQIYADGKKFYGIYRFESNDPDALLQRLKEKKVTHVIMASLRKNPAVNNGQTINTIHRYLYAVSKKYPLVFKLEHQIGKDEPAYLFRVDYGAVDVIDEAKKEN